MGLSLEELGGWPAVLGRLMRHEDLSSEQASAAFDSVLTGEATPAQIAAFAAALRTKGETIEEMRGLVAAMRAHGERVEVPGEIVDTCGTGGDRSGSMNVSTMAALVVAAGGARVCKHGGRAASSLAGSGDVFEALGVAVELGPVGVARCIEETGIGFCLAPRFHPAMRHAAPVRRELGVATVFNFLGPLANPAGAVRQLVGVGDPAMAEKMLAVLEANGAVHAMVVHGRDGLDEMSTGAVTDVLELVPAELAGPAGGRVRRLELDASAYGLARADVSDLKGGDAEKNARIVRSVLAGEPGPGRDFVVWNGAAGLVVAGKADSIADGVEMAGHIVDSGAALSVLDGLIEVSNREAGATRR